MPQPTLEKKLRQLISETRRLPSEMSEKVTALEVVLSPAPSDHSRAKDTPALEEAITAEKAT